MNRIDRHISQSRLAVWSAIGLATFLFTRAVWPLAWQVASFGAIITLLWPFVRHSSPSSICHRIEIGLDLGIVTGLIAVTGGFGSPFAPLVFVVVLEALALLGKRTAVSTALTAALLAMVHFRAGLSPQSILLYGLATGALMISALLAGLGQHALATTAPAERADLSQGQTRRTRRNTSLQSAVETEDLLQQLNAAERTQDELREKYRAATLLHRDQRNQLTRMRAAEQLFAASVGIRGDDTNDSAAFSRLLRLVIETTEAESAILWLRARDGERNMLVVQSTMGQISESIRREKIGPVDTLMPSELRARCEAMIRQTYALEDVLGQAGEPFEMSRPGLSLLMEMEEAVVPVRFLPYGEEDAVTASDQSEEAMLSDAMWAAESVTTGSDLVGEQRGQAVFLPSAQSPHIGVVVLRAETTAEEPGGRILGAIGVCSVRRSTRNTTIEPDPLQALGHALTLAVTNIVQRVDADQRIREVSQLYDLSRMAQTATEREQVYQGIVEQVMQAVECENCTLFLLDADKQRLEARVTRGRAVDLLEQVTFDRGHGVSGWVAAHGKPLHIPDLMREKSLLSSQELKGALLSRVRSFAAIPLRSQDGVLGVINVSHTKAYAFSPDDMRLFARLAEQAAVTLERMERFHTMEMPAYF